VEFVTVQEKLTARLALMATDDAFCAMVLGKLDNLGFPGLVVRQAGQKAGLLRLMRL
jgi:hypothetical protein